MNSRDSPACSAAPQSSAQRSSLRAWLKVMARVVVVTTDGRAVLAPHHQRRQPLAFAVPLVGGKPLDVRGGQLRGVVAAAGRVDGQERAQLGGRAAEGVEGAAAARAVRGAQQVSQVVP